MSIRPLDGITVVSLEHAIAAPFCTRQLADLGARIIKVERPGAGDFARAYDERVNGMASHFAWVNRSKEAVVPLPLPNKLDIAKLETQLEAQDIPADVDTMESDGIKDELLARARTTKYADQPEMNFPARVINLKIQNDKLRTRLESLE